MTPEQKAIVDKAVTYKTNGWTFISVTGTPYECGFQEGYLLVDEFRDAMRVYKYMTLQTYGMSYEWFQEQSVRLHKDMIPEQYSTGGRRIQRRFSGGMSKCIEKSWDLARRLWLPGRR